jgi:hypothetical protein
LWARRWTRPRGSQRAGTLFAASGHAAAEISTGGGTRRVRLVRGAGGGVSDQYGGRGETLDATERIAASGQAAAKRATYLSAGARHRPAAAQGRAGPPRLGRHPNCCQQKGVYSRDMGRGNSRGGGPELDRRVRLVRGEGRGVSDQYGGQGGGGGTRTGSSSRGSPQTRRTAARAPRRPCHARARAARRPGTVHTGAALAGLLGPASGPTSAPRAASSSSRATETAAGPSLPRASPSSAPGAGSGSGGAAPRTRRHARRSAKGSALSSRTRRSSSELRQLVRGES